MYELFEHTADLGLRVRAPDLNTLFGEAGECLFTAIVEDIATVDPQQALTFSLAGTDREYLLFDWLRELLTRFDSDRWVFRSFEVDVTDTGLSATVWGQPLDRERHPLNHEVKAITYHGLRVEEIEGEWLAEVIVDI